MNVFKRTLLSLARNSGKSTILLLLIFVLGCVIAGTILVRHAIENTDTNIRADLPPIASIRPDILAEEEYERATGRLPYIEPLTMDILTEVALLPYVRQYDFSASIQMYSSSLERHLSSEGAWMSHESVDEWQDFWLKGVLNEGLLDADVGVVDIVSGRGFTESEVINTSYVALISQEFARLNHLGIGSSFTLENIERGYNAQMEWDSEEQIERAVEVANYGEGSISFQHAYDFEVIGIFVPIAEISTGHVGMDAIFSEDLENRIYVPNTAIAEIIRVQQEQGQGESLFNLDNVFVLHDIHELDNFRKAAAEIIPQFDMVQDASASFAPAMASMDTFVDLAATVMWVTVGAAVIIISLLMTLFLRTRKNEFGIYLALGEKKCRVVLQIMTEVLIVALVAITLALFMGNLFADFISEDMIRRDMVSQQNGNDGAIFGVLDQMGVVNQGMAADELLEKYDVSLGLESVIAFFTVSLATIAVATIVPMGYIVGLNPRKILM